MDDDSVPYPTDYLIFMIDQRFKSAPKLSKSEIEFLDRTRAEANRAPKYRETSLSEDAANRLDLILNHV